MAYPILAPSNTWYKSAALRSVITEINIVDSYTPTGNETESWNADVDDSGSIKCYISGTILTIAGDNSGKIALNADSRYLFSYPISAVSDADKVFTACAVINGLELFDSSNVADLTQAFGYCSALTDLDLSSWDVRNVTTLRFTFGSNAQIAVMALKNLNLSGWNITNKCASLRATFQSCPQLEAIDVSGWDTSGVTELRQTFANCSALKSVDVSNWNTGKVTTMLGMFQNCVALEYLDVSRWDTSSVTDTSKLFRHCHSLANLDVSHWDTGNVTTMSYMFSGCRSLTKLDVSHWDTGSVTTMSYMFNGSSYAVDPVPLTELDVSNWDVSNVTDMGWAFYGTKLKTLDLSKWDVSKVESFHHCFAWSIDLVVKGYENFKLTSCKTINAMFHSNAATHYDVSNWDVSTIENFSQTFENNKQLVTIKGLDKWNTSSGKTFKEMFQGCHKLRELDLSSFDTRNADDTWIDPYRDTAPGGMYNMFGCKGYNDDGSVYDFDWSMHLQKITLGKNFSFNGNGSCARVNLVAPEAPYIPGADGKWYTRFYEEYTPENVPNLTAGTYYASLDMVDNLSYLVKNKTMYDMATAIRTNTGKTEPLDITGMIDAISDRCSGVANIVVDPSAEIFRVVCSDINCGVAEYMFNADTHNAVTVKAPSFLFVNRNYLHQSNNSMPGYHEDPAFTSLVPTTGTTSYYVYYIRPNDTIHFTYIASDREPDDGDVIV